MRSKNESADGSGVIPKSHRTAKGFKRWSVIVRVDSDQKCHFLQQQSVTKSSSSFKHGIRDSDFDGPIWNTSLC